MKTLMILFGATFISAGKVQHLRAAFNVNVNRNSLYSCNLGYHQNLDEHCVKNICTCANGQTKVDCVSNNKHICASCNSGYHQNLDQHCVKTLKQSDASVDSLVQAAKKPKMDIINLPDGKANIPVMKLPDSVGVRESPSTQSAESLIKQQEIEPRNDDAIALLRNLQQHQYENQRLLDGMGIV